MSSFIKRLGIRSSLKCNGGGNRFRIPTADKNRNNFGIIKKVISWELGLGTLFKNVLS